LKAHAASLDGSPLEEGQRLLGAFTHKLWCKAINHIAHTSKDFVIDTLHDMEPELLSSPADTNPALIDATCSCLKLVRAVLFCLEPKNLEYMEDFEDLEVAGREAPTFALGQAYTLLKGSEFFAPIILDIKSKKGTLKGALKRIEEHEESLRNPENRDPINALTVLSACQGIKQWRKESRLDSVSSLQHDVASILTAFAKEVFHWTVSFDFPGVAKSKSKTPNAKM